ncbi:MAG TPA: aldehyde dehydrogenase family protein [Myxococcales bacterium]|nr:aldehyde dehydrogenase family protein [Myxococcales bacterium]
MADLPVQLQNLIGGEWVPARSGKTQKTVCPADTRVHVANAPISGEVDVAAAVAWARKAQPAWARTPIPQRGVVLGKAAQLLAERKEEVARAMTVEEGKTLAESRGEVDKAVRVLEFNAAESRRPIGEVIPSEIPGTFCYTTRTPVGLVAAICPWNFPVCIPVWKLAPALLAGNAVIFKPATLTPWTGALVARVFADAGLPPGVLAFITGPGGALGQALVDHPAIAALSFTGSNEVGGRLYADGARAGKKVQCEMGGKNALVVLDDADLELAAQATVSGAFGSTGQRCTATSRAVVDKKVVEPFTRRVLELAKALSVGDGLHPETRMGPSVDERQMKTVLEGIAKGKKEGAKLLCGGERLTGPAHANGFFVAPTVFGGVTASMSLAQEELFGPVLAILEAAGDAEALELANSTRYGLTASVYTRDLSRAQAFADGLEAGMIHVNNPTVGGEAQLPFGGVKATGVGAREMGRSAWEFYSEMKTVYVDTTGRPRTGNLY